MAKKIRKGNSKPQKVAEGEKDFAAQDIFQSATGKSGEETLGDNIFQLATGKCLPPVLCLTTFTNLVLIASCCNDAQEQLFYIVYSYRERLKAKELEQSIAHDAYTSLLGGDKKNYSRKLKELYPTAPVVIKDQAFLDYLALPERHRESKLRREIEAQKELYRLQVQDSAEIETLMSPVQPKRKLSSANKNGKTKPCLNDV